MQIKNILLIYALYLINALSAMENVNKDIDVLTLDIPPKNRRDLPPSNGGLMSGINSSIPGSDRLMPYNLTSTPVNDTLTPGSDRLMPDSNRLMPYSGRSTPVNGILTPGSDRLMPDSNRLMPDSNRLMPDSNRLMPDSNRLMPDSNRLMPDSNRLMPDSNRLMPDSGRSTPVNGVVTPGSDRLMPDSNRSTPVNGVVTPGSDRLMPDSNRLMPYSGRSTSSRNILTTDTGYIRTENNDSNLKNDALGLDRINEKQNTKNVKEHNKKQIRHREFSKRRKRLNALIYNLEKKKGRYLTSNRLLMKKSSFPDPMQKYKKKYVPCNCEKMAYFQKEVKSLHQPQKTMAERTNDVKKLVDASLKNSKRL